MIHATPRSARSARPYHAKGEGADLKQHRDPTPPSEHPLRVFECGIAQAGGGVVLPLGGIDTRPSAPSFACLSGGFHPTLRDQALLGHASSRASRTISANPGPSSACSFTSWLPLPHPRSSNLSAARTDARESFDRIRNASVSMASIALLLLPLRTPWAYLLDCLTCPLEMACHEASFCVFAAWWLISLNRSSDRF
jgi:hypothetical protein